MCMPGAGVGWGGTLGISSWGCAAGTLEPLTYTRASSTMHTLHRGTYLYSPYLAVPPPPPLGVYGSFVDAIHKDYRSLFSLCLTRILG